MIAYIPKQGDIIMMNFNPQAGHEQGGRRPALVISNASFHHYTRPGNRLPHHDQDQGLPDARQTGRTHQDDWRNPL